MELGDYVSQVKKIELAHGRVQWRISLLKLLNFRLLLLQCYDERACLLSLLPACIDFDSTFWFSSDVATNLSSRSNIILNVTQISLRHLK